jgi:chorismate-pyruvate lyase
MPPPHARVPDGSGDHGPEEVADAVNRFASPVTRMLLTSDGLTTTMLTALAGEEVSVREVRCRRIPAREAPHRAIASLGAADGETLVLRRSVFTAGRRTLAVNRLAARESVLPPRAAACLTDAETPIGAALKNSGALCTRTVLTAGRVPWPHAEGPRAPAAFRSYLLWYGREPVAAVREVFSPEAVPAMLRGPYLPWQG